MSTTTSPSPGPHKAGSSAEPDTHTEGTMAMTSPAAAGRLLRIVVVGLGIAGRARVRDIPSTVATTKGLEHVSLAGFVSRRTVDDLHGVPQLSLDDVMQEDNDIEAVIISTENARHEELAKRALAAKKHVLVDYPLALSASAAKQLYVTAHNNGVFCYEEDIGMLTDQYGALRNLVKQKGSLIEAGLNMQGGFNGWIEDLDASGSPYHSSMNLLHTLVDFFGDLTPYTSTLTRAEGHIEAKAVLQTKDKRLVTLTISRGQGMTRQKTFKYLFADGTVIDHHTNLDDYTENDIHMPKPLFMRDLYQFVRTIDGHHDNSYNQWLTIRSLEIADELFSMASPQPKAEL